MLTRIPSGFSSEASHGSHQEHPRTPQDLLKILNRNISGFSSEHSLVFYQYHLTILIRILSALSSESSRNSQKNLLRIALAQLSWIIISLLSFSLTLILYEILKKLSTQMEATFIINLFVPPTHEVLRNCPHPLSVSQQTALLSSS